MQVTHTTDHVTHAVIAAHETMDMGISSSAEFFHILSSTLYTDQIMAVVRETVCNAWDAHIDAGVTDTPIQIALTDDTFAIRDFGKGIHKDLILPIYGVYGASTKKNDGGQTGGFGLGCKAPFAYTDHFEVTSCHEGTKSIYTMSKSSGRVGGKPAITPVLHVPSTETGITVKIKLKGNDRHQFLTRLRRILKNGEINATVNDEPYPIPYKFSECKHGYMITNKPWLHGQSEDTTERRVVVRYGNVIYPIEKHDELTSLLQRAEQILNKLSTNRSYSFTSGPVYYLCLLAPPNSISVAPSREALSNQDKTINTLKGLLTDFITKAKFGTPSITWPLIEKQLDYVNETKNTLELMSHEPKALWRQGSADPLDQIYEPVHLVIQNARITYPEHAEVWNKELRKRIALLEERKVLDRGLTQVWLRIQERPKLLETFTQNRYLSGIYKQNDSRRRTKRNWVAKHVFVPIRLAMKSYADLTEKNMWVIDPQFRSSMRDKHTVTIDNAVLGHHDHFKTLGYARKVVFLSRFKNDAYDYIRAELRSNNLGEEDCLLFYNYQNKSKQFQQANELFTKLGYKVIDLTEAQTEDMPVKPVDDVEAKEPKTPRRKGYASLANAHPNAGYGVDFSDINSPTGVRIEDPEFWFKMTPSDLDKVETHHGFLSRRTCRKILPYIKDKGAVAINTVQAAKLEASNVMYVREYVARYVADIMMTNKNIRDYWTNNPTRIFGHKGGKLYADLNEKINNLMMFPAIRKEFRLVDERTKEEKMWCEVWHELSQSDWINYEDVIPQVLRNLYKIPVNSIIGRFAARVVKNPILAEMALFDLHSVSVKNPQLAKRISSMLIKALKG